MSIDLRPATAYARPSLPVDAGRPAQYKSQRLDYVDSLRGLAAIQVLLSHVGLAFFIGEFTPSPALGTLNGDLEASPLYFLADGASAVCIFFVLSGYVLTPLFSRSRASGTAHIYSRFLRLALPAVASCAFSALLFHVFGGVNVRAAPIARSEWFGQTWRPPGDLWFVRDAIVNGVLLGFRETSVVKWFGVPGDWLPSWDNSYVSPLWTLSVEFYGSILVLLFTRMRSWTLLLLAMVVFSRSYMFCFLAGHAAARLQLGVNRPLASPFVTWSAIAVAVMVCVVSHFWTPHALAAACAVSTRIFPPCPHDGPAFLARIYGATVLTVAIMQNERLRSFLGREGLRHLGRLSFPIYLTHWPIVFGIGGAVVVLVAPVAGGIPARAAAAVATIILTLVAAKGFERIDQFALRASRDARKPMAPALPDGAPGAANQRVSPEQMAGRAGPV